MIKVFVDAMNFTPQNVVLFKTTINDHLKQRDLDKVQDIIERHLHIKDMKSTTFLIPLIKDET